MNAGLSGVSTTHEVSGDTRAALAIAIVVLVFHSLLWLCWMQLSLRGDSLMRRSESAIELDFDLTPTPAQTPLSKAAKTPASTTAQTPAPSSAPDKPAKPVKSDGMREQLPAPRLAQANRLRPMTQRTTPVQAVEPVPAQTDAPAPAVGSGTSPVATASDAHVASRVSADDAAAETPPGFAAAYLHNPGPAYPAIATQRGWQGEVVLRVHVLETGAPDQIDVQSGSGHDSLDQAAVDAVRQWRFTSARRGGQSVDGWVRVPMEFRLANGLDGTKGGQDHE